MASLCAVFNLHRSSYGFRPPLEAWVWVGRIRDIIRNFRIFCVFSRNQFYRIARDIFNRSCNCDID